MGYGFKGTSTHDEIVCKWSERQRQPCRRIACTHHVCHVKVTQAGTEYYVRDMRKEGACNFGSGKTL